MRKKIFLLAVCMMLVTTAAVSAVRIMNNGNNEKIQSNQISIDSEIKSDPGVAIDQDIDEEQPAEPVIGTAVLSIPAAAFTNCIGYIDNWQNSGGQVYGSTYFVAPVYFPEGAEITRLSFDYYDVYSALDASLSLLRTDSTGSTHTMAQVDSSGSSGYGNSATIYIDYPDIHNMGYSYYLFFFSQEISLIRSTIQYNYPESSSTNNFGEVSQENGQTNPLTK